MNASFPNQATVVIVGGGIVGCSTAYNLAIRGCSDVVLLEKHKLTSGSTWHAAGAVGQLRTSANVSWLLGRSVEIYSRLEEETGQATGWHQNGSLRLATNADRRAEYERAVTTARSYGLEMEIVSPREAKQLFPLLDVGDLVCAAYVASDGMTSPSDAAMALAAGARMNGVRLIEDAKVIGFGTRGGAVDGVITDKGTIPLRIRGQLCRHLVARDRAARRRQRAHPARLPSIHGDGADRGPDPRPPDHSRPRQADLFSRDRRSRGRRLRAPSEALSHAADPGGPRVQVDARGCRPLRTADDPRDGAYPSAGNRGRQAMVQRHRVIHRGWHVHPRGGAGAPPFFRRHRLQRVRNRLRRRRRLCACGVDSRRPAAGRSVGRRHQALRRLSRLGRPGVRAGAGGPISPFHDPLAARGDGGRTPPPAQPHPSQAGGGGSLLRNEVRLGAPQLVRAARRRAEGQTLLREGELVSPCRRRA